MPIGLVGLRCRSEDPTPGEGLPGLDCLVDSLGVSVNEIHDEVPSGGSGHLSTGKYSIGIYSTGQDLTLSISDKDGGNG